MRPPSSGNAGTRLNSPSTTLTKTSQVSRAESSALPEVTAATTNANAAIARLVSGPTAAISASARALVGSPSSLEAAEQPQRDARDLDTVAAGGEGERETVGGAGPQ